MKKNYYSCPDSVRGLNKILLTMRISFVFSLCCILNVSASLDSQSQTFNLNFRDVTVKDVFKAIEDQSQYRFFYNDELSDINRVVTVNISNKDVDEVLSQLLDKSRITYKVLENNLIVIAPVVTLQQVSVTGKVTDVTTGEALPGVNIVVEGTTTGVTTDIDGNYKIEVPNQDAVLIFSYVGYLPEKVTVGGQSTIDIKLTPDIQKLEEVVVIGYGTVKKKDLTGAVSSIKGDELKAIPAPNVVQAMQGKLAGVNIISQDGRPGASISIRVRGGGSISQSNNPLILVDGVTVNSLSDIPADQVESIDVLKDASSTAIYGARGANGVILVTTKGVKEGKALVTYNGYVKFNTPYKYLQALGPYDYLKYVWANAAANGSAYQDPFEKLFGIGAYTGTNTGGIESYRNLGTDDIQKKVYNNSVSWNHDLTVTGGTDKTKMLFSTNYLDEQGMKINSYSKRANVSFKVAQQLFKNVDLKFDTRFTDIRVLDDETTTNGTGSILSSAYRFRPIATSHILGDLSALREGNLEQYGRNSMWDSYSPAARIGDYFPLSIRQDIQSTISLNWVLIKGLTYHTDFTLNRTWNQTKNWSGAIYNNYIDDATGEKLYAGAVDYRKNDSWGFRWSNTLSYNLNFAENNDLNILLGQEITNSGGTNLRIQANHYPSNFTSENAFALLDQYDHDHGTSTLTSGYNTPQRIVSFFGRANYTLMDKYLFTVTFRADGSSKFSPTNRWGYFPAGAFAWKISEEPFMKNINQLDNLKLRVSYGEVGNNGISSDLWSQVWTAAADRRFQYVIDNQYQAAYDYLNSSTLANINLKWETTITRDLGIDYAFFNSRLSGTIDIYKNTTKDLLMLTTIPGITGFTATYANIGQTSNKGVEFSLTGDIFKNRDWDISASANINFNKGNVDKLATNVTGLYGTGWASSSSYPASDYILEEGHPVGLVRGLVYDGFYTANDFDYSGGTYTLKSGVPDLTNFIGPLHGIDNLPNGRPSGQLAYPGIVKYKDLNNDGVIDDKDVTVIGDMNPVHTGGFNLNVTFKNIDFGAYFNWSYGNQIYNVNKLGSLYGYKETGVYENKLAILKNSYKIYDVVNGQLVRLNTPDELNAANVNASLPLAYNENGITSTLGIENGSYLRLNTLTVGYTIPKTLVKRARIENLRIYGSIYNLLTITGYSGLDPEVDANISQNNAVYPTTGLDWGAYPRARSFVVGVNLSF